MIEHKQTIQNHTLLTTHAIEYQPTDGLPTKLDRLSVFLAGSIEQGKASNWQRQLIESLADEDIIFFNPRRTFWDDSWPQEIKDKNFYMQVNWELDALGMADLIVMYLEPGTLSPISLLEFGLFADSQKLLVCCPEGYWRKGNVDIVCQRYGIPMVSDFQDIKKYIESRIYSPNDDCICS